MSACDSVYFYFWLNYSFYSNFKGGPSEKSRPAHTICGFLIAFRLCIQLGHYIERDGEHRLFLGVKNEGHAHGRPRFVCFVEIIIEDEKLFSTPVGPMPYKVRLGIEWKARKNHTKAHRQTENHKDEDYYYLRTTCSHRCPTPQETYNWTVDWETKPRRSSIQRCSLAIC